MPPRKQEIGMSGLSAPHEWNAMGRQRSEPVARTPVRDSASATGSDQNQWGVVLLEMWREEPWPASHYSKEVEAQAWQGPMK
jgi:hypothetical protein